MEGSLVGARSRQAKESALENSTNTFCKVNGGSTCITTRLVTTGFPLSVALWSGVNIETQ